MSVDLVDGRDPLLDSTEGWPMEVLAFARQAEQAADGSTATARNTVASIRADALSQSDRGRQPRHPTADLIPNPLLQRNRDGQMA